MNELQSRCVGGSLGQRPMIEKHLQQIEENNPAPPPTPLNQFDFKFLALVVQLRHLWLSFIQPVSDLFFFTNVCLTHICSVFSLEDVYIQK